jgi:hypothetical protein
LIRSFTIISFLSLHHDLFKSTSPTHSFKMHFSATVLTSLIAAAGIAEAAPHVGFGSISARQGRFQGGRGGGRGGGRFRNPQQGQKQIVLDRELLQLASSLTGQEPGTEGIKPGQAASKT